MYQKSQTGGPTLAFFVHMSQHEFDGHGLGLTSHGLDLTGVVARMRQAISAVSIGAGSHEELDTVTGEFVAQLRETNTPPEQVLLAIKRILAEAGLRPSHQPSDPAIVVERHAAVYRNVIASSIRHYFRTSDGDGSTA